MVTTAKKAGNKLNSYILKFEIAFFSVKLKKIILHVLSHCVSFLERFLGLLT